MMTPDEFEVVINLTTREGNVDLIAARDEEIRQECAERACVECKMIRRCHNLTDNCGLRNAILGRIE